MHIILVLFFVFLSGTISYASKFECAELFKRASVAKAADHRSADSFRHLEDLKSPETLRWVEDQNTRALELLTKLPERKAMSDLLAAANVVTPQVPLKFANTFLTLARGSVFISEDSAQANPVLLVNVPEILKDKTAAAVDLKISPNGEILSIAYGFHGSDFPAGVFFYDLKNRNVLNFPHITHLTNYGPQHWVRGPFWLDDSSLVYTHVKVEKQDTGVAYPIESSIKIHKLGDDPSMDKEIFHEKSSEMEAWYARPTGDGRFLILETQASEQEPAKVLLLEKNETGFKKHWISKKKKHHYIYLGDDGDFVYFRSGNAAKNLKVSRFSIAELKAGIVNEHTIVNERDIPLHQAVFADDKIIVAHSMPTRQQAHQVMVYSKGCKFFSS